MEKRLIGIIGFGVVGKALSKALSSPLIYDKNKDIGSKEEIKKADLVFICVPTPYKKGIGFDDSAVREALSLIKEGAIAAIKSTVLPGTTEKMQKSYPSLKIFFNPEFLREKSAENDVKNPSEQVVGFTNKSRPYSKELMKVLPKAPNEFFVPATEAEMLKYFSKSFLATKVIFANQFYDLCRKTGVDYEKMKKIAKTSPKFTFSHFDIWTDGFRGYNGKCLPKDIKSIIQLADKVGVGLDLLKLVDKANDELKKS